MKSNTKTILKIKVNKPNILCFEFCDAEMHAEIGPTFDSHNECGGTVEDSLGYKLT